MILEGDKEIVREEEAEKEEREKIFDKNTQFCQLIGGTRQVEAKLCANLNA